MKTIFIKYIKILFYWLICFLKKLIIHPMGWILILIFIPKLFGPTVLVHYSSRASEPIVFHITSEQSQFEESVNPGEVISYDRSVFQTIDDWFVIGIDEGNNRHWAKITPPFSRVDVYLNEDKSSFFFEKRIAFLERFTWLPAWVKP